MMMVALQSSGCGSPPKKECDQHAKQTRPRHTNRTSALTAAGTIHRHGIESCESQSPPQETTERGKGPLNRAIPIIIGRIGSFAALHHFPSGRILRMGKTRAVK